jgi:hypothetical protein
LEHRPNPHTREGKTAIVGVLGVEKLTLQHTQRNEMDTVRLYCARLLESQIVHRL